MICKICGKEMIKYTKHLKKHNMTPKEYYDTYLKKHDEDKCIECGIETKFINLNIGYNIRCKSCNSSIGQKKRYENPEERMKTANRLREMAENPEFRKNLSIKLKERYSNPEIKKQLSESMKNSKIFQDMIHSENYALKMSKIVTERYKIEENRIKMSIACKNSPKMQKSLRTSQFREQHSEIMKKRIKNGELMVRYKYNGISFMSLPEFAYYKFLEDNNYNFEYQCEPIIYTVNGVNKKYIPDFKVEGTYIEIKGPHLIKNGHLWNPFNKCFMPEKEQCMKDNNVVILNKNCYMKFVNWFIEKYGNDFILKYKIKKD